MTQHNGNCLQETLKTDAHCSDMLVVTMVIGLWGHEGQLSVSNVGQSHIKCEVVLAHFNMWSVICTNTAHVSLNFLALMLSCIIKLMLQCVGKLIFFPRVSSSWCFLCVLKLMFLCVAKFDVFILLIFFCHVLSQSSCVSSSQWMFSGGCVCVIKFSCHEVDVFVWSQVNFFMSSYWCFHVFVTWCFCVSWLPVKSVFMCC